ncbi:glycine/sarcosine/betaine reductase component B subunit [Paramaledivibacter caminithermalis]|jgi:D-proline reductase (dithiol) PrdE|uniref:D-proline reductase (Dithiol) PrdE n=1 Tax=Paramaledivibacter caminithermalis (strain DSM 15212 / CIP 107654 / DViRD3) TaxID=1121301 RepID=A0A1M6LI17_PARC5|nr:glycine/sarcosine/betaine reductase component B subunit [Paramaledivibacter caminithermalis]SHJ70817.1 D-proline reductase (dithiol) PrdE [Paramaledivibacter caminithermalis DSM 15212]
MGIGPSTKETTLHHFRDPLLEVVSNDEDVNLLGVVVVGTPQSNKEKYYVGKRTAVLAEALRADGVIISVDGWGNSHVDYANTIEEIGKRKIPLVGLSFIGTQAKFVVTNKYMDTIVDFNKSKEGIETEVVGENNVNHMDCKKALAFLKLKMKKNER